MREVSVTNIFKQNYEANNPVVINRGGARSSKSHSLYQLMIQKVTNEAGKQFLLTRKTTPALLMSLYKDFIKLLVDYDYYRFFDHNKSNKTLIYRPNDSLLQFAAFDDPKKMRSTEWNYILMEEATDFTYDDYMTLKLRLSGQNDLMNQIYLAFNPVDAFHWVKTEVLDVESDVLEIVSTYKDNPFLPEQYVERLESTKEQNPTYWKIYGEGEWGTLENIVYNNYSIEKARPDIEETIYGLDFGFVNETGLVKIGVSDGEYYIEQRLYKTGLTNSDLITKLKLIIPNKNDPIYADCAEPARIEEIARAGFNIHPADKSVKDGLDYCKRSTLHIHFQSTDLIKEIRGYSHRTTREGIVLEEPVKMNDHLMDAMRYALYTHYGKLKIEYGIVI